MSKNKAYSVIFIILVLLFFLPSMPLVEEFMIGTWPLSLAMYWVVLSIIAIAVGLRAIKGVE